MNIQFATNTPIKSAIGESTEIAMTLDQAQKDLHLIFTGRISYSVSQKFTLLMYDPDAPNPSYLHLLIVNSKGVNGYIDGNNLVEYLPPQRENHRYIYAIYKQTSTEDITVGPIERSGFNTKQFASKFRLEYVTSIIVTTKKSNPMSEGSNIKMHGFIKASSPLQKQDRKYCTCLVELQARGQSNVRNKYAVCKSSTGGSVRECGDEYDLDVMSIEYLKVLANNWGIKLTDPKNRLQIIRDIKQWKRIN